jgi:hypothetical protein
MGDGSCSCKQQHIERMLSPSLCNNSLVPSFTGYLRGLAVQSMQGWAGENLPRYLRDSDTCWQPTDWLPDPASPDFHDQVCWDATPWQNQVLALVLSALFYFIHAARHCCAAACCGCILLRLFRQQHGHMLPARCTCTRCPAQLWACAQRATTWDAPHPHSTPHPRPR